MKYDFQTTSQTMRYFTCIRSSCVKTTNYIQAQHNKALQTCANFKPVTYVLKARSLDEKGGGALMSSRGGAGGRVVTLENILVLRLSRVEHIVLKWQVREEQLLHWVWQNEYSHLSTQKMVIQYMY